MILETDKTQALLFDLDGTLVDSMWLWGEIDVEYLGRFGIAIPQGLQRAVEGLSFQETAVYFKERFAIPDSVAQIRADWNRMAWDKYTHEVPLKPGARLLLAQAKERGIPCAIATSNSRELTQQVLRRLAAEQYFATVVTGSEIANGKPAPDIYLEAAARAGADPSRCTVFEDIVSGIRAGRAAGMRVCAVRDEWAMDQDEEKRALADWYAEGFGEIEWR